jgi:hypothetical protein
MWTECRTFIVRGSVMDLAVGVSIGAAFGKIVTTLVEGILDQAGEPPEAPGRNAGNAGRERMPVLHVDDPASRNTMPELHLAARVRPHEQCG